MGKTWIIRGREIIDSDITLIRDAIEKFFHKGRKYISRQICHQWKWYQPNGQTKDMACRYIYIIAQKRRRNNEVEKVLEDNSVLSYLRQKSAARL